MKKFGYVTMIAATCITAIAAGVMGSKTAVSKTASVLKNIKNNKSLRHKAVTDLASNKFCSKSFTDDILFAMINSFEKKMPYSEGHSARVAGIALALGEKLHVSDLDGLYYAALLHDIGKMFIPKELLSKTKPGMTEEELSQHREHPKTGATFVKSIYDLSPYSEAVEHHHECFDGSGYPDKLSGNEIPLFSRIISVADAYEAMSSERPNREAYPREYIIQEFNKCSGKQFDPAVVKAMMSVIADLSE